MNTTVLLIGGCALVTAVIKAVGPVALGGRELPERFTGVIALMAPALLAALVVTATLADADEWAIGPETAGVAAGGLVAWLTESVVGCVVVAAVVTALVRARRTESSRRSRRAGMRKTGPSRIRRGVNGSPVTATASTGPAAPLGFSSSPA